MKKIALISLSSLILILAGCSKNNEQVVKPPKKELTSTTSINMNKNVKKAPKRVLKNRVYKKKKLKYRDTSESSKVRVYDPKTKTALKTTAKKELVPTSVGGKIFFDKACNLCHKRKENRLGPSLKKLARGYKNKENELVLYLQRKGKAIIQPERESIMRTQLAKLRILSESDYNALSKYILSGGNN